MNLAAYLPLRLLLLAPLALVFILSPLPALAGPTYVPTEGVWQVKIEFVAPVDQTCIFDAGGNSLACVDNPVADAACTGTNEAGDTKPCYFIGVSAPFGTDLEITATNEKSGVVSAPSNTATLLSLFSPNFLSWQKWLEVLRQSIS